MELPFAESYKIKMVEPLRKSTRESASSGSRRLTTTSSSLSQIRYISTVLLTLVQAR